MNTNFCTAFARNMNVNVKNIDQHDIKAYKQVGFSKPLDVVLKY